MAENQPGFKPRAGFKDRREAIAGLLLRLRAMGLPHALMQAFEKVPRQNFVPVMYLDESYGRGQLPIECGQIMPSADHVARVLMALEVDKGHRVLEIGTGSGYQAALLGQLGNKVTSLERFRTLVEKARHRIASLEIGNVNTELADGSAGRKGHVYDRIVANVAYARLPAFISEQLASDGVALVPVGKAGERQTVIRVVKSGDDIATQELFAVRLQSPLKGISRAI